MHVANVLGTLLKLYSSSASVYKGKSYAEGAKQKIIDQPCVSLYGSTTPGGLFDSLSSKDISNGLLSRVVLFDAGDHDPIGRAPGRMEVPQVIIDWLNAWDAMPLSGSSISMRNGAQEINPTSIMLTDEAHALALAFVEEMHHAKVAAREHGMDSLYVRASENALKFALIRACAVPAIATDAGPGIDVSRLCVDADTMRWACDLSRVTIASMEGSAKEEIVDDLFGTQIKKLRAVIRKAGPRGMTTTEIKRTPAGRIPKRTFEDVLGNLTEGNEIFHLMNMSAGKRGRPRAAYIHADCLADEVRAALEAHNAEPETEDADDAAE